MFSAFMCKPCHVCDPTSDTVTVNMAALGLEPLSAIAEATARRAEVRSLAGVVRAAEEEARREEARYLAEEERARKAWNQAWEQQQIRSDQALTQARAVQARVAEEEARREEARCLAEAERVRKAWEEQQQIRWDQALTQARAVQAKRRQEEAESLRRAEEERLVLESKKRKEAVAAFLIEHDFTGVNASKRSMLRTTYPLHFAAEMGKAQVVEMLIQEGADTQQKKSAGKTPVQMAQKKNKNGSHAAVIRVLSGL